MQRRVPLLAESVLNREGNQGQMLIESWPCGKIMIVGAVAVASNDMLPQ